MIVGDPNTFAIESDFTQVYERLSFRALGFFVLHIGGRRYGLYEPEATLLACSFDEVNQRIARRGTHTAPFAEEPNAGGIADALRYSVFGDAEDEEIVYGIPRSQFVEFFYSKSHIEWAPDGDQAFDDGSRVLHFDVQDRVRLIAYGLKPWKDDFCHDPDTLKDVWLNADEFYGILQRWHDTFEAEWKISPKILQLDDGAERNEND